MLNKRKPILLLAALSLVSIAAADPVVDFNAAKTSLQSAFDALKAERDAALAALAQCKLAPGCYIAPPPPPPPPAPPPAPAPTPAPVPPPVVDPTVPTSGLAKVADGQNVAAFLQPGWGTGAIPVSAAPYPPLANGAPDPRNDVVGAFRFNCRAGQVSYDDPIVYPGQPGKSHLHQFFGNTGANASSTYASLRTTGETTCMNIMNRSAYWMPAMMNGKGQVINPDFVSIYYKRRPNTDPLCAKIGKACVDIPRGLRFIFGYDMLTMGAKATGGGYFNCDGSYMANSDPNKAKAIQGHYKSIVEAGPFCPIGAKLGAVISAPECWDGKNLDSADHRSHVAYSSYIGQSYPQCPGTHPYVIPTFTMGAWWSVDDTLNRSGVWNGQFDSWHLSSDNMPGMPMKPGTTFHSDWFGAWNDEVMALWHANCINKLLNCSGGELGNGQQLKQIWPASGLTAVPHLVNPPPKPSV